jgi:valyl-tRNA synthetase
VLSAENLSSRGNRLLKQDEIQLFPLPERYIINRLHEVINEVTKDINEYSFQQALMTIHDFIWNDFADWYIEFSKFHLKPSSSSSVSNIYSVNQLEAMSLLCYVFNYSLRLLHPFMPFITETLFQALLKDSSKESLMNSDWPSDHHVVVDVDREAIKQFQQIQSFIRLIRNIRAEYNVEASLKIPIIIVSTSSSFIEEVKKESSAISFLCKLEEKEMEFILLKDNLKEFDLSSSSSSSEIMKEGKCLQLVLDDTVQVFIPQKKLLNVEKEKTRLSKVIEKLQKEYDKVEKKLNQDSFRSKAPSHMIKETEDKIQELKQQLELTNHSYERLLEDQNKQ